MKDAAVVQDAKPTSIQTLLAGTERESRAA